MDCLRGGAFVHCLWICGKDTIIFIFRKPSWKNATVLATTSFRWRVMVWFSPSTTCRVAWLPYASRNFSLHHSGTVPSRLPFNNVNVPPSIQMSRVPRRGLRSCWSSAIRCCRRQTRGCSGCGWYHIYIKETECQVRWHAKGETGQNRRRQWMSGKSEEQLFNNGRYEH